MKLSVHDLVDFLLRAGDIDSRVYNQETMQMGSKLHAAYQEKQGNEYLAEYPLSGEIKADNGVVAVQGRADGIIVGGPFPIIDEIKSTVMKLDDFFAEQKEWHLGQALCYAYLFLKEHKSNEIGIQLTYLSQIHSDERASHSFRFTREEVEEKVVGYVHDYFEIMEERFRHIAVRDASIQGLPFPYYDFRPGQRELSKYVYGVNKRGGVFFAEAPTGIGKTISTLYPSVLSFKKGNVDRVFYLTAKNSGADAACDAIGDLYRAGFVGRDSTLFAKDKICFMPGHACNPDDCPFAKGYYTKLKAALAEATKEAVRFDYAFLSRFCRKKEICPFEFKLDLSLESDIII
ncbi:MAG: hypothetical protein HUJ60_04690, partial [Bacilli bacterium]|nr:hypothetical protein [Bacilli bacterium]